MSTRRLTSLFYDDRRLLLLALSLIAVAGLASFYTLPRMEDPVLTQRAAIINVVYPGAGPERIEALVTEKLEEELQEIEEIKELRSSSRAGISTTVIELQDQVYQVDEVWSRVRDKMDDAATQFPAQAGEPDFEILEVTGYALIVGLAWDASEDPNFAILRRHAEELEDLLRSVPGTRDVDRFGDPQEEILVELDPDALAALDLTPAQVARQLSASDAKVSAGSYRSGDVALVMEIDEQLDSLERIRQTPIGATQQGRFVRIADVAQVQKAVADPAPQLALVHGQPAVVLGALVQGDRRVDHWSESALAALEQFRASLPGGITAEIIFQQNNYVADRLSSLLQNLFIGAGAVVTAIWLMMGWRSAIVVGAALPIASLMVLAGMRLLGIPMHQMSITGLIIALGLLIDNAIVMVDEVRERRAEGASARDAVSQSVRHLFVPLFGSTVTTALSFAPIALMPGPAGEFVGSIALSVILAVGSSFLLAMTITPSLIAILDRPRSRQGPRRWWRDGLSSARLATAYRGTLQRAFERPALGIALGMTLPIAGFLAATTLTEQFFPPADRDQFQIQLSLPSQASIAATRDVALEARQTLLAHPQVDEVHWFVGQSAPSFYYNMLANRQGSPQYAQALVQLERGASPTPVIHQLQSQLNERFPQAQFLVRQLEQGPPFEAPVEVRLYGPELATLRDLGEQLQAMLAGIPDVTHTKASLSEALPKLAVQIDEQQARLAGLDHAAVAEQLEGALEGALGGSVLEETEELPVRVRTDNRHRGDLGQIAALDLLPSAGVASREALPLDAIAKLTLTPEISVVSHFNTRRMNEVQAYITAGVLPAQVQTEFERRLDAADFTLPPGYEFEFGGEASKRDDAVGNLMSSVGVLVVMMVATLVLSFSSFRMALLVGAVAALSVGLGLGSIALFGYPFGFMAIVGTMGLIGVAINDSIVVLAALRDDQLAREGNPTAVVDVVMRASRHVVSTTLTTVAGFMPLILAGGGFWPPLAAAIAGGVLGATLLALYFAPSAYILLMCRGCRERRTATRPAESRVAPPVLAPQLDLTAAAAVR